MNDRECVGTILTCPACGNQHRKKYVPVDLLHEARAEIVRLTGLLDEHEGTTT